MTELTPPVSVGFDAIKPRRFVTVDPYASETQTIVLLRRGAEYRLHRINASDMITIDEAALLSGTSRVTINAWIKSGRCIGVAYLRSGLKIPKWQFDPSVLPVLQAVSEALGVTDWWPVLSFLETPHAALAGLTPRIALEQGMTRQRIFELATAEGH
ncbi:MAG: hypothetical protein Q7J82_10130 [Coriobacteriia bacterium]|nr:hypothetical protein [Coriobacteriia bacterium]